MKHIITKLQESTYLAVKGGRSTVSECAGHLHRSVESTRACLNKLKDAGLLSMSIQRGVDGGGKEAMLMTYEVVSDNYTCSQGEPPLPYGTHPDFPMMSTLRAMLQGNSTVKSITKVSPYGEDRIRVIVARLEDKGMVEIDSTGFVPRISKGRKILISPPGVEACADFFAENPHAKRETKPDPADSFKPDAMDIFLSRPA